MSSTGFTRDAAFLLLFLNKNKKQEGNRQKKAKFAKRYKKFTITEIND